MRSYFETYSKRKNHKVFHVGSLCAALILGLVEGSSVSIIILTNIPWCLTIALLLDMLVYRFIGVYCYRPRTSHSATDKRKEDVEMIITWFKCKSANILIIN